MPNFSFLFLFLLLKMELKYKVLIADFVFQQAPQGYDFCPVNSRILMAKQNKQWVENPKLHTACMCIQHQGMGMTYTQPKGEKLNVWPHHCQEKYKVETMVHI